VSELAPHFFVEQEEQVLAKCENVFFCFVMTVFTVPQYKKEE
jgi:hypothetical protein